MKKSIAIIGAGPAGLMAAEVLSQSGIKIDIYDAMPSFGRKLLMAGKSGLNLTHSEPYEIFLSRFGNRKQEIAEHIKLFTPDDLIAWAKTLNVETFVGTSGRVFPKEMKASPLLRAWLKRLQADGVIFHVRHRWQGWEDGHLIFDTPNGIKKIKPDATILALGGASWPKLGSSGDWVPWFLQHGVKVNSFQPANCGFTVNWSTFFIEKFHGSPIKSVILTFKDFKQQGEFVVTRTGVEGSLIYTASAKLRDEIASKGNAVISLDLVPQLSKEKLIKALSRPRNSRTLTNHIKVTTGIHGIKMGLLYEFISKEDLNNIEKLADAMKSLCIKLCAPNSIVTAISSAGGVSFEELDRHLMLLKMPGVFCAGEMLDWEAPTGGYLLTACFAMGRTAGNGARDWVLK